MAMTITDLIRVLEKSVSKGHEDTELCCTEQGDSPVKQEIRDISWIYLSEEDGKLHLEIECE